MSAWASPPGSRLRRPVRGADPARVEGAAAVDLGRADELERDAAALDRVEDLGLGVDADRLGGDDLGLHHRRHDVVRRYVDRGRLDQHEVGHEELAGELPGSRRERGGDADDEDVAGPAAAGERPRYLLVDGVRHAFTPSSPAAAAAGSDAASARYALHRFDVGAVDPWQRGRPGAGRRLHDSVDLVREEQRPAAADLRGRHDPLHGHDDGARGAGERGVGVEEEVVGGGGDHVALLVGSLGVDDGDVRPDRRRSDQLLARVRAGDVPQPELGDEIRSARPARRQERKPGERSPQPGDEDELAVLEGLDLPRCDSPPERGREAELLEADVPGVHLRHDSTGDEQIDVERREERVDAEVAPARAREGREERNRLPAQEHAADPERPAVPHEARGVVERDHLGGRHCTFLPNVRPLN